MERNDPTASEASVNSTREYDPLRRMGPESSRIPRRATRGEPGYQANQLFGRPLYSHVVWWFDLGHDKVMRWFAGSVERESYQSRFGAKVYRSMERNGLLELKLVTINDSDFMDFSTQVLEWGFAALLYRERITGMIRHIFPWFQCFYLPHKECYIHQTKIAHLIFNFYLLHILLYLKPEAARTTTSSSSSSFGFAQKRLKCAGILNIFNYGLCLHENIIDFYM